MASILDVFRSEAGKMRAKLSDARNELERARRRREELQTLPLPADDLAAMLFESLDRRAAEYPNRLVHNLNFLIRKPLMPANSPGLQTAHVMALSEGFNTPSTADMEMALWYMFRDQVREGLLRALKAGAKYKVGPPRAERERELAELETQIAQLERDERDMLAALDEARRAASPD